MPKLDKQKVKMIKTLLLTGAVTHKELADLMGVTRSTITRIATGQRWGDVVVDKPEKIKRLIYLEYEPDDEWFLRNLFQ
jgi:transcriptional regulator with XRE-family HTH domain